MRAELGEPRESSPTFSPSSQEQGLQMQAKRFWQRGDVQERLLSVLSPLLLLALWEFLVRVKLADARFFPSPTMILGTFGSLAASGELSNHITMSLTRIVIGFLMGTVPALLLGVAMGLSPWVRAAINPIVGATYPIPKIAILPLIMLSDPNWYPLTVGLHQWNAQAATAGGQAVYNLVITGSLLTVIPIMAAFLYLQRYWRSGLAAGSVKA